MTKSEQTKQKILNVALELFLQEGFERTTMRKIAKSADMTPGAAYYYFPSKEHIIFHFYEKSYDDHLVAAENLLYTETDLHKRIAGTIAVHLDIARPYQNVSRALFKVATDPEHALSPFSRESRDLRNRNIELFREAIQGSNERIAPVLEEKLPEILWLFKIAVITYWIYDRSENQKQTYALLESCAGLILRLLPLARVPGAAKILEPAFEMLERFKPYE